MGSGPFWPPISLVSFGGVAGFAVSVGEGGSIFLSGIIEAHKLRIDVTSTVPYYSKKLLMTQTRIHTTARLYVENPLEAGSTLTLAKEQSHYLAQVLRRREGDMVRLFNGMDGEWRAVIAYMGKKEVTLQLEERLRMQVREPDLWLVFAPVKHDALGFIVEKATELGVAAFHPVITQRTIVQRINNTKLEANIKEASEQCERLTLPMLAAPVALSTLLDAWPEQRLLFVCDEMAAGNAIQNVLLALKSSADSYTGFGLMIGPEGGFTDEERHWLQHYPFVVPVGLGPRILRADTAALAALACLQSVLGDWQLPPRFHFD